MTTPNVATPEPGKDNSGRKAKVGAKFGLSGHHGLSISTCVRTLTQVTISRRGLLNLEMAVGLAVFLDAGKADKISKGMLNEIYSKAGYECHDSKGKDYKTVNRRIQASAGLFGKLGLEVINHWAAERGETKLINAVAQRLVEMNFRSLDDVLDYIGRTSNRTAQAKVVGPARVATVKTRTNMPWNIEVGDPDNPTVISLPPSLTEAQLVELASKIMALAQTVHEAVSGTRGPDGGKERRQEAVVVSNERRAARQGV